MIRGRGDEGLLAAGGSARHVPVLRAEILAALAPQAGGLYLDATFGAGGYTRAILEIAGTRVLALDRDPTAIAAGGELVGEFGDRLQLVQSHFAELGIIATRHAITAFDGIVFDIGVSSMQLDEAARGFSFRLEGPLDMRMDCAGRTAAEFVNEASEEALADVFYYFGEERAARRIARAIVHARTETPFTSTVQLADTIARANPGRPGDIHPATRSFQALRIAVNDELGEFAKGLAAAEMVLRPGGCLAVVTFHSLEDRIAKLFFAHRSGRGEAASRLLPGETARHAPTFEIVGRQPIVPSPEEIARNPRARSAKLRFGRRTAAPPQPTEDLIAALPQPKTASARKTATKRGAGSKQRRGE